MTPKEFSIVVKREGGTDEFVPVGSYPLITRRVSGANGWKVCKFQRAGYYHRGSCTTYEVTSNLCAKVRLTDGSWGLDDTYGGHGCSPRGNWDVPERKRIKAPSQGNPPKLSSVRLLGAGHAVLHDGHDPLFAAMNLTGGGSVLRGESGGVQRDGDGDAHRWNHHVGPGGYPRVSIRETFASLRWSARRVQEIQAGQGYRARPLRRGSLRRAKG